MHEIIKMDDF